MLLRDVQSVSLFLLELFRLGMSRSVLSELVNLSPHRLSFLNGIIKDIINNGIPLLYSPYLKGQIGLHKAGRHPFYLFPMSVRNIERTGFVIRFSERITLADHHIIFLQFVEYAIHRFV